MHKAPLLHVSVVSLCPLRDHRGSLTKLLRASHVPTKSKFGEIYTVSVLPGQERGGHYHLLTNEWFFVLSGKVELHLNDCLGQSTELALAGEEPQRVFVPAGVWHEFRNVGHEDVLILAWADKEYDPQDSDIYSAFPGYG